MEGMNSERFYSVSIWVALALVLLLQSAQLAVAYGNRGFLEEIAGQEVEPMKRSTKFTVYKDGQPLVDTVETVFQEEGHALETTDEWHDSHIDTVEAAVAKYIARGYSKTPPPQEPQ